MIPARPSENAFERKTDRIERQFVRFSSPKMEDSSAFVRPDEPMVHQIFDLTKRDMQHESSVSYRWAVEMLDALENG